MFGFLSSGNVLSKALGSLLELQYGTGIYNNVIKKLSSRISKYLSANIYHKVTTCTRLGFGCRLL